MARMAPDPDQAVEDVRSAGQDPKDAQLRSEDVVEHYEQ